jgi:hypothetical protein
MGSFPRFSGLTLSRILSRSKLVRQLSQSPRLEAEHRRQDFAERLGQWINAADSIMLHSVLQAPLVETEQAPALGKTPPLGPAALEKELFKVRSELTQRIQQCEIAPLRDPRLNVPSRQQSPKEPVKDSVLYGQLYIEQQHRMELKIRPLRRQIRQSLAQTSPSLRRLAALDAVMERALAGREHKLLGKVPVLMEGLLDPESSGPMGEDPMASVERRFRSLLLAELEVRLEPVMGLLEAFSTEVNQVCQK